jgi:hypothetical protein
MEPVVSSLYVDEGVPLTHCGTLQQEVGGFGILATVPFLDSV